MNDFSNKLPIELYYWPTSNGFKILKEKKLGNLGWIEYRDLKKGSEAFREIHNGTCIAPKIILIP